MNNLERVLNVYRRWAQDIFGEEVEVRWCTDFGCYPQDRDNWLIEIGMLAKESDFADLPDFFHKNFTCKWKFDEIQFYTLCFLHECGHLYTWDLLPKELRNREKSGLTWEDYRNLPTEFAADEWANEYLNNNRYDWFYWQTQLEQAYGAVTQKDLEEFVKNA